MLLRDETSDHRTRGGLAFALRRLGILPGKTSSVPPANSHEARITEFERTTVVLEERMRDHDEARSRIGRVHERIDEVAASTAHIDGPLIQLDRSVGLPTEHLLNRGSSS